MGLNSEQEKNSLKESLKNTDDLNQTLFCLECVLKYRTPFALYVATADRSDCTWIFERDLVISMLGGEEKYNQTYNSLMESDSEEEESLGVLFFIFKKVGPLYAIKVDLEIIDQIVEELYEEI